MKCSLCNNPNVIPGDDVCVACNEIVLKGRVDYDFAYIAFCTRMGSPDVITNIAADVKPDMNEAQIDEIFNRFVPKSVIPRFDAKVGVKGVVANAFKRKESDPKCSLCSNPSVIEGDDICEPCEKIVIQCAQLDDYSATANLAERMISLEVLGYLNTLTEEEAMKFMPKIIVPRFKAKMEAGKRMAA